MISKWKCLWGFFFQIIMCSNWFKVQISVVQTIYLCRNFDETLNSFFYRIIKSKKKYVIQANLNSLKKKILREIENKLALKVFLAFGQFSRPTLRPTLFSIQIRSKVIWRHFLKRWNYLFLTIWLSSFAIFTKMFAERFKYAICWVKYLEKSYPFLRSL